MVVDDDEQRPCTAAVDGDGGEDDHLSGLPDDVLLDILEKVVMDGDAHASARTCILSRRWRHLPWHNITNISLDVEDFIPDQENAWRPVLRLRAHHQRATEKLAAALASFLAAPPSRRVIDKLRLKLVLTTDDHVHRVGALVGDAFDTGRVKAGVELEILAEEGVCTFVDDDEERLMLGYGRRFARFRQACPGAFRSLSSLTVHNLWFDGGDPATITHLLHGCPALEYLNMFFCGFLPFSVMTINAPPESRLATLVFDQCFAAGVERVNAPKLKDLYYRWLYDEPVVSYGATPSLNGITLENFYDEQQDDDGVVYDFNWKLSKLIPENPGQLERLCIKSFGTKTDNHVCYPDEWRKKWRSPPARQPSPGFKHHHLAELRIRRAFGVAVDLPFARMVMEMAINLEHLAMGVESECDDCDAAVLRSPDLASSRLRFPGAQQHVDALVDRLRHGISTSALIEILGVSE